MTRWTEIPRKEYERRVLAALRKELLEASPLVEREGRITMEDVRLETSVSPHRVQMLFREVARPGCLFGFWAPAVEEEEESSADPIVLDTVEGYWGPEDWASTIVVTHFEEQVAALDLGLPPDCDPDATTWVNGYRRLPPERARGDRPKGSVAELDEIHDNWMRSTDGMVDLLENMGWLTSSSVPHALIGSAEGEGASDFRYHVIVYAAVLRVVGEGREPVFELYDEARAVVAYTRTIPSPERASELLRARGVPMDEGDRIRARLPEPPEQLIEP